MSAVPPLFVPFGSDAAFAKGKGSGKGGGSKKKSKSRGKSSSASGKANSGTKGSVANASASAGKPKAVVRRYVIEKGLKQGEVARVLKSWNSLNRNEQAYLNNMDNPNSLPGMQIAYIRDNLAADLAFAKWEAVKGDLVTPPTLDQSTAAQFVIDRYDAWTAYEDALAEDPTDPALAGLLSDFEALGGDPLSPPTAEDSTAAQLLVDQYDAWDAYDDAKMAAENSFILASVSDNSDAYSQETHGDLREDVNAIIALKELDKLVVEYDAAAAVEPEPEAPAAE